MHSRSGLGLWAVLLIVLGATPTVQASEATDRAALETAAQSWIRAFNADDVDALLGLATQDVVLLDPENAAPINGAAAARTALRKAMAVAGEVTLATKEATLLGDFAWRIGAFDHKLPTGELLRRGQTLEIWKREAGQWKLHRIAASFVAPPSLRPRFPNQPVHN